MCDKQTHEQASKSQAWQQAILVKAGRRLYATPDNGDVIFDLRNELFLFKIAVGHVNDTLTH